MKIKIHSMAFDGKPIIDDGRIVQAPTCLEVAERMHHQTPFTADLSLREYQRRVLAKIEGDSATPLPDDPEQAAAEFFTRMARHGWVEFMPDEDPIESPYPDRFQKAVKAVRDSGRTNMFDIPVVIDLIREMGCPEVALWITGHLVEYVEFIIGEPKIFFSQTGNGSGASCAGK
ncbi:MAG: DUF5049 domain-containing protein [Pontiellaceae bacterium]|nr:DUF5049 domain-containing protein [Pontiellaceae bacterium]MBN2785869.1 DUF5049 domain-containing protein [Pontiellaceae bacterium]